MPIIVQCSTCGRRHTAGDHLAGQLARCSCGSTLQVPRPQPAVGNSIRCNCTSCGAIHTVGLQMAGKQARCRCGAVVVVPHPARPVTDPLDDMLKIDAAAAMLNQTHQELSNPYWVKQFEAEERKRTQKRQRKQKNPPPMVSMACRGLAIPGALSIVIGIIGIVLLVGDFNLPERLSNTLIFVFTAYHLLAGSLASAVAVMIANRVPAARFLGFPIAILYLCGSPVHIVAGITALIGLASPEMAEFMED